MGCEAGCEVAGAWANQSRIRQSSFRFGLFIFQCMSADWRLGGSLRNKGPRFFDSGGEEGRFVPCLAACRFPSSQPPPFLSLLEHLLFDFCRMHSTPNFPLFFLLEIQSSEYRCAYTIIILVFPHKPAVISPRRSALLLDAHWWFATTNAVDCLVDCLPAMSSQQQALIADTVVALRKALKRKAYG